MSLTATQVQQIVDSFTADGIRDDAEGAILAQLWHHPLRSQAVTDLVAKALNSGYLLPLLTDGPHWSASDVDVIYPYVANALSPTDMDQWFSSLPGDLSNTSVAFRVALFDLLIRTSTPGKGIHRNRCATQATARRNAIVAIPGVLDSQVLEKLLDCADERTHAWALIESYGHRS